jgi:hypothetical protein
MSPRVKLLVGHLADLSGVEYSEHFQDFLIFDPFEDLKAKVS